MLGPITGDHWFVYVADKCERPAHAANERTLNVMMFDISQRAAATFHKEPVAAAVRARKQQQQQQHQQQAAGGASDIAATAAVEEPSDAEIAREMTRRAGIDTLCPGATIDAAVFSPCGYSMNAITFDSYATAHITPEPEC